MFDSLKSWTTAVGTALVALGAVGCGAYEPEPEVPQYEYAAPPRPLTADELAQQQAAQQAQQGGDEVAIGEDTNADEYTDTDPSALTEFKPALDGHGAWVEDASYGTVWVPASTEVGTDFQPYVSAGHWTYADDTDYVWVSDYSWGWAPFHYGRWVMLPGHGWSWIPGRRYAGAWVTWRTGPVGYGYVGWAPSPPSYYWSNGYAVGWSYGFYRYHDHYVYCAHDRFYGGGGVSSYVVRGPAARTHYDRTVEYQAPQRVAAAPTVNGTGGRVLANPGVGAGQRVAATPTVRRGPRPEDVGMGRDAIVAPPGQSQNAGMDRARTLAAPSSAIASGARAPAVRTASLNRSPATNALVPNGGRGGQPAFRSSAQPSVGGRSPSFSSSSPSAPSQPRVAASPSFRSDSRAPVASSPAFRPSSPPASGSPVFRPSQPAQPSVRSSSPSFSSRPSMSPSAPARSTPSPSFRSSAPSVARPSVAPSAPSRSSGSGGSIIRSSPSVSAPRQSSGGSRSSGSVRRR